MARILKGAPVAKAIRAEAAEIAKPFIDQGLPPTLCLIRATEDEAARSYERSLVKAASELGFETILVALSSNATEDDIISAIQDANMDVGIDGTMLLAPLPNGVSQTEVMKAIYPAKDIDGASFRSLAGIFTGSHVGFAPATPEAVIRILDHYDVPIEGSDITVIGRSLVVGKPLAMMLLERNATVTLCHSRTSDISKSIKDADIVVSAVGSSRLLSADAFEFGTSAQSTTVIDVGVNVDADGSLCGDVDFDAVSECVSAITPVPGGVGAVVSAVLLLHCAIAAKSQRG